MGKHDHVKKWIKCCGLLVTRDKLIDKIEKDSYKDWLFDGVFLKSLLSTILDWIAWLHITSDDVYIVGNFDNLVLRPNGIFWRYVCILQLIIKNIENICWCWGPNAKTKCILGS